MCYYSPIKNRIKILIAAIFSLSLISGSIFLEPKIDAQPVDAGLVPSHYDETPSTVYSFVTYDGNPKPLVTAGVCSTGTVEYKLDDELKLIWPSHIDRGIQLMEKIGLIRLRIPDYCKGKYSRQFEYFYENEIKFLKYCKDHNIEPLKDIYKCQFETINGPSILKIKKSRVRFSGHCRFFKPKDLSCPEFEKELLKIIYENYPELEGCQRLAKEINEKFYSKDEDRDFRVKANVQFNWNDKNNMITKISFRPANSLVRLERNERKKFLEEKGLALSSDVNCSVPRLNKSFNIGHWYEDERDLYKVIFDKMYPNVEFKTEYREMLKTTVLRAFFEKTPDGLSHHVSRAIDITDLDQVDVKRELFKLKKALVEVCGPVMLDTEIYYIEACVYLRVLHELLKDNKKVWQVFDGFYSKGIMMNEFFDVICKVIFKEEFNKFMDEYLDNRKRGIGIKLK